MVAKCDEETVFFAVITTEIITVGTIATWDKINIVSKTNDLIKTNGFQALNSSSCSYE